ncbi:MAG: glycerophosphodiester phosphodiesterase [Solirubrobacteraceae bacterium]|nr:glycerophosphodiester phosphodiesterase [Solirubrobacteraceae bacterium]
MSHRLARAAPAAFAAALVAAPAAGAADNPWLAQRVLSFAHQGGEDELPSNTMYALKRAVAAGADALELDVGATRDDVLVVLHDNRVDRTTNGTGSVNDLTLAQVRALDAAHWFVPGRNAVHGLDPSSYPLRGVRTGEKPPPAGFTAEDFRVPTLEEVLRAFPDVPVNVEIKGRDGADDAVFLHGAELLAQLLNRLGRTDVIVASFNQRAVDRFHELAPRIGVAPGIDGTAAFLLGGGSPGDGVVALQIPITFRFGGQLLTITTADTVTRAHDAGYAVHVWLSNDTEDRATYERLLDLCVDGIMAARPSELERLLAERDVVRRERGRVVGLDPCGTRVAAASARVRGGVATLPLRRRGQSQERRAGTVTLRAGRRVVGRGRFALATGRAATTARVRLTRAGRRALAARPRLRVVAEVAERVPAGRRTLTLRR